MTNDMDAVRAISDFLRHARERDLPDEELFTLKARAFDLMAAQRDEDGPAFKAEADECRQHANEARDAALAARLISMAARAGGADDAG